MTYFNKAVAYTSFLWSTLTEKVKNRKGSTLNRLSLRYEIESKCLKKSSISAEKTQTPIDFSCTFMKLYSKQKCNIMK